MDQQPIRLDERSCNARVDIDQPSSNGPGRRDSASAKAAPARNLPHNLLSTTQRQTAVMHVHLVLTWNLQLRQPQLPRSEPDGQPIDSPHLAKVPD